MSTSDIVRVNTWEFVVMACENIYGIGFNAILFKYVKNVSRLTERMKCALWLLLSTKQTFFSVQIKQFD